MGSSSSSRSGCYSSSLHSATRRRSPPDSWVTVDVRRRAAQRVHGLLELAVQVPGVARGRASPADGPFRPAARRSQRRVGHLLGDLVVRVEQPPWSRRRLPRRCSSTVFVSSSVRLLLQHPDGEPGHEPRFTVGGLFEPGHDLEHASTCRHRWAHDADLGPGQEGQGDVVEDHLVAVRLAHSTHRVDELRHTPSVLGSDAPSVMVEAAQAAESSASFSSDVVGGGWRA